MQKEWRYFLLALGFFTRIPVPDFANFQESDLNHSTKYFPLIGIIVGFLSAAFFYAASFVFPHVIAVLISMAATIYLTGAFHEDGLADSADGIGGGWEREQILTIMQDSRLGTYGAVALFLMLIAKFQTLSHLNPILIPLALIAGHALSRLWGVLLMATLTYTKPAGKAKPLATQLSMQHLAVATAFGLLPLISILGLLIVSNHSQLIIIKFILLALLPSFIIWLWWRAKLMKNLGGYTGDTLGAAQQLTELAFYMGVLAWSMHL
ncbi:adenosylcobinamide-GDP ribazoletransferase [Methylotenera versatilis]|uniref:adenosylcobinamide-GDP ribazoletransferase n=1 Tax=Methylotenera versatilis TaxID=1055487 RepID=UPI0006479385|nr:adenosylcobinamide-GDP ribazoletransferase [Methylotenera versatilis]